MAKESDLQTTIVRHLRSKGCFAWKMQQNATTPAGVSDVFFCKEQFYGFLEVKRSKNAPRRPGQEAFVRKMDEWSYARVVWPENWPEIKKEIEELLK